MVETMTGCARLVGAAPVVEAVIMSLPNRGFVAVRWTPM
jgi:hypothetical protein